MLSTTLFTSALTLFAALSAAIPADKGYPVDPNPLASCPDQPVYSGNVGFYTADSVSRAAAAAAAPNLVH